VENGLSPRLSLGTGIWCFSAQAISAVRLVRYHSRQGLDARLQRVGRQLEAHLVVALAGRAVGDGVGAGLAGDLDQALGDQRPRDRGAEQIVPFIAGIGAHHREDEIAHEFLAQIVDVDVGVGQAHQLGLGPRRLQLFALAQVGGEGHDLAPVSDLQPLQDDRGVEAARIGENDLLDVRHDGRLR
jgi:hypothetical protein